MQGDCHEKSSTLRLSRLDRRCCVGWRAGCAARLLRLLALRLRFHDCRHPDAGVYDDGRAEADIPDLRAPGTRKGAPLVVVMHGAGENGALIRIETGYEFERLADEHGFAVV